MLSNLTRGVACRWCAMGSSIGARLSVCKFMSSLFFIYRKEGVFCFTGVFGGLQSSLFFFFFCAIWGFLWSCFTCFIPLHSWLSFHMGSGYAGHMSPRSSHLRSSPHSLCLMCCVLFFIIIFFFFLIYDSLWLYVKRLSYPSVVGFSRMYKVGLEWGGAGD